MGFWFIGNVRLHWDKSTSTENCIRPGSTLCSQVKVQFMPVPWHLKHKTQHEDVIISCTWQQPMLQQMLARQILKSCGVFLLFQKQVTGGHVLSMMSISTRYQSCGHNEIICALDILFHYLDSYLMALIYYLVASIYEPVASLYYLIISIYYLIISIYYLVAWI